MEKMYQKQLAIASKQPEKTSVNLLTGAFLRRQAKRVSSGTSPGIALIPLIY